MQEEENGGDGWQNEHGGGMEQKKDKAQEADYRAGVGTSAIPILKKEDTGVPH